MNTLHGEGWAIVKVNGVEPHYRLFIALCDIDPATKRKWILNDGITGVQEFEDFYMFTEINSLATFHCHKHMYYMFNDEQMDALQELCIHNTMVPLLHLPDLNNFDWLIKDIYTGPR